MYSEVIKALVLWNSEDTMICLNPDFRRDAPKDKPYCVRCQKEIKDVSKAVQVTVDWATWEVKEGGKELIGKDCWKQITQ